jgi:hypothetical protein
MTPISGLVRLAEPWADLYSNHPLIQSTVVFAHLAGQMVGGGAAIATDRAAVRAYRADDTTRQHHLHRLHQVHRTVLVSLALIVASGILLLGSDLETFLVSPIYWLKMGTVFLLALNGWVITRTGKRLEAATIDWSRGWGRMRITSVVSLALWLLIAFAGVLLVNLG